MNILFLTPQVPYPPHQGTTLRNYNIIKCLARHHTIDLLTFGQPGEIQGSPLQDLCRSVELVALPTRTILARFANMLFSPLPDMARRLESRDFDHKFDTLLKSRDYDVLQVEGIEMAPFWQRHQESAPPAVFDDHNAEYVLQKTAFFTDRRRWRRAHAALYSLVQWRKLERFERKVCLESTALVAVSTGDAEALVRLHPGIKPIVIPNGVDTELYKPVDDTDTSTVAESSVVFTGKMDFRPNVDAAVWFSQEILPLLRQDIPSAHITIVGQNPGPGVESLRSIPGVMITGRVPDTRPYIAKAGVYAVPLRMGGGTRLKVLEAMAMGKAIVSTSLGSAGIACVPGRDLVIADSPGDFARSIAALLADKDRRRELGRNARRLVELTYDWEQIVPKFEQIYTRL